MLIGFYLDFVWILVKGAWILIGFCWDFVGIVLGFCWDFVCTPSGFCGILYGFSCALAEILFGFYLNFVVRVQPRKVYHENVVLPLVEVVLFCLCVYVRLEISDHTFQIIFLLSFR